MLAREGARWLCRNDHYRDTMKMYRKYSGFGYPGCDIQSVMSTIASGVEFRAKVGVADGCQMLVAMSSCSRSQFSYHRGLLCFGTFSECLMLLIFD
jgi:hypothetical protein